LPRVLPFPRSCGVGSRLACAVGRKSVLVLRWNVRVCTVAHILSMDLGTTLRSLNCRRKAR
jgi:hypothetical protein